MYTNLKNHKIQKKLMKILKKVRKFEFEKGLRIWKVWVSKIVHGFERSSLIWKIHEIGKSSWIWKVCGLKKFIDLKSLKEFNNLKKFVDFKIVRVFEKVHGLKKFMNLKEITSLQKVHEFEKS